MQHLLCPLFLFLALIYFIRRGIIVTAPETNEAMIVPMNAATAAGLLHPPLSVSIFGSSLQTDVWLSLRINRSSFRLDIRFLTRF